MRSTQPRFACFESLLSALSIQPLTAQLDFDVEGLGGGGGDPRNEVRALTIAFYAVGTALGGIAAPWLFGTWIGTG